MKPWTMSGAKCGKGLMTAIYWTRIAAIRKRLDVVSPGAVRYCRRIAQRGRRGFDVGPRHVKVNEGAVNDLIPIEWGITDDT